MKLGEIFKVAGLPAIVASLCCLSPVILVVFGLSTVSFAGSLSDLFYGEYRWAFRATGLVLLAVAIILYIRRERGICTIDEAKKRRQEIINITLVALSAGILLYILFLYVVVHYAGVFLGIWADYF